MLKRQSKTKARHMVVREGRFMGNPPRLMVPDDITPLMEHLAAFGVRGIAGGRPLNVRTSSQVESPCWRDACGCG